LNSLCSSARAGAVEIARTTDAVSEPARRKLSESEINLMFFSPMTAESYWGYAFFFS
jgi:hypothetical protein